MSDTAQAHIGIIGCAIAGLSTAIGIAHAGHKVTLFGNIPTDLPGALQLAPNGFAALHSLSLLDVVADDITRLQAIEIRSAKRNIMLSCIDHDKPHYRAYGAIGRATLVTRLTAYAKAHNAISFCDEAATSITAHADETSLVTQSGTTHHFDLLIGADGHKGLARDVISPSHSSHAPSRIALRASQLAEDLPRHFATMRTKLWLGDGFHLVSYPYYDCKTDKMIVNLVLCTKTSAQEAAAIIRPLLASNKLFTALTDEALSWHKTPLPAAHQATNWRKEGLVLIGDAAHFMPPHLAQGAGQTLEDAATFSTALAGTHDLRDTARSWALDRQRTLRPIIEKAEATGAVMRLSGPLAMVRNAAIDFGGQKLIERWLSQVWQ